MSLPSTKPGQEENSEHTASAPKPSCQDVLGDATIAEPEPAAAGAVPIRTHLQINPAWVGAAVHVAEGVASVRLMSRPEMVADDRGLVHGGFTFGLADYAAMLAVNDPYVVLGAASTRFLAPVRLGQAMLAHAQVTQAQGKKRLVQVEVKVETESGPQKVFEGEFTCFVLAQHVLGPTPSPTVAPQ